jgi:hypothetical protein
MKAVALIMLASLAMAGMVQADSPPGEAPITQRADHLPARLPNCPAGLRRPDAYPIDASLLVALKLARLLLTIVTWTFPICEVETASHPKQLRHPPVH